MTEIKFWDHPNLKSPTSKSTAHEHWHSHDICRIPVHTQIHPAKVASGHKKLFHESSFPPRKNVFEEKNGIPLAKPTYGFQD